MECEGHRALYELIDCPVCSERLLSVVKERGLPDPEGFLHIAKELVDVLHSARNSLYELDLDEYLFHLCLIIAEGGLVKSRRLIPKSLPKLPERVYSDLQLQGFHHDEEMCLLMARLLYRKYHVSLDKGKYKIVSEPWYNGGKADVGLVKGEKYEDLVALIAVEVGEVRTNKLIDAFKNPHLRELWIYPYAKDARRRYPYPRQFNHYYVFKRGPQWDEIEFKLRNELKERLRKASWI